MNSEYTGSRCSVTSSPDYYGDLLKENEQLKAEIKDIKRKSTPENELQQQILSLELKLTALQSEYDEAEKAGYALHDYIKKAQSAWTNANARALSANQARTEADAEVQSLRSALEKAERKALKIEQEHNSEVEDLKSVLNDFKEKYLASRKELRLSRKEYSKLINSRSMEMQNNVPPRKEVTKHGPKRKSIHIENPKGMIVKVDKQSQISEDSNVNFLDQQITMLKADYKSLQDYYLELKQSYNEVTIENSDLKRIAQDYEMSKQAIREFNQSMNANIAMNEIYKDADENKPQTECYVSQNGEDNSFAFSVRHLLLVVVILVPITILIHSRQIYLDFSSVFQPP